VPVRPGRDPADRNCGNDVPCSARPGPGGAIAAALPVKQFDGVNGRVTGYSEVVDRWSQRHP
jgi:hypothetical protein